MTPLVVGLGVALVAGVVIWLVASIQRLHPVIGDIEQTLAEAESEAEAIVAAAEAKAAGIVSGADTVIAEARETAGRAAAEIRSDAKRTARGIIKEAEYRGRELVETAELQRVHAEQAAARAQEFAERSRREFAELVLALLAHVRREPVTPVTHATAAVELDVQERPRIRAFPTLTLAELLDEERQG